MRSVRQAEESRQRPTMIEDPGSNLGEVVLISLEPWDEMWRRNQHLASRLPALGLADHVTFVNPARWSGVADYSPVPGVTVHSPRRRIPKRLGGLRVSAFFLKRRVTRRCDTLWINDPTTGAWLSGHDRVAYDVTDDWRTAPFTPREIRRLIAAEDRLAEQVHTIVCSAVLQRRWKDRYGVDSVVVRNAVNGASIASALPRELGNSGPHIGYVGTLHKARLDPELVLRTADFVQSGSLHLVGPDCLTESVRSRLRAHPRITLHGGVPASEVPSWLVAFDVLICPHVVTDFTLSLDAIKAYEYLATTRPVVATATSGFQEFTTVAGVSIVAESEFPRAVRQAVESKESFHRQVPDWDDRAREFAGAFRPPAAPNRSGSTKRRQVSAND
jgi:teichuronic acid biosynthesis glycosyltransferase TuaH